MSFVSIKNNKDHVILIPSSTIQEVIITKKDDIFNLQVCNRPNTFDYIKCHDIGSYKSLMEAQLNAYKIVGEPINRDL